MKRSFIAHPLRCALFGGVAALVSGIPALAQPMPTMQPDAMAQAIARSQNRTDATRPAAMTSQPSGIQADPYAAARGPVPGTPVAMPPMDPNVAAPLGADAVIRKVPGASTSAIRSSISALADSVAEPSMAAPRPAAERLSLRGILQGNTPVQDQESEPEPVKVQEKPQQKQPEPAVTEAKPQPKAEQPKVEQAKTEQAKTEQPKAEQAKPEPSRPQPSSQQSAKPQPAKSNAPTLAEQPVKAKQNVGPTALTAAPEATKSRGFSESPTTSPAGQSKQTAARHAAFETLN